LARRMVCEWGMSEKLGPMTFGKKEEEIFLGRDFTQKVDYSESTAIEIDAEVRRIIQDSYHKAKDLLKTNLRLLHKVAESLLEKEVLDGSEIDAIVKEFGGNGGDPLASSAAAAIAYALSLLEPSAPKTPRSKSPILLSRKPISSDAGESVSQTFGDSIRVAFVILGTEYR